MRGVLLVGTCDFSQTKQHVLLCNGTKCIPKGAEEVTQRIRAELRERNLDDVIHTSRTRCNGRCKDACVVVVYPQGAWYKNMEQADIKKFVDCLVENEVYTDKLTHRYNGEHFVAEAGTVKGTLKADKVAKNQQVGDGKEACLVTS